MKPVPDVATLSSPNVDQGERERFRRSDPSSTVGTEKAVGKMDHGSGRDDPQNVMVHGPGDEGRAPSVSGYRDGVPDGRDSASREAPMRVRVPRGGIDGRIHHALREVALDGYTVDLSNVYGRDLARAARIAARVVAEDVAVLRTFITLCEPWLREHRHAVGDECQRCLWLPEAKAVLAGYEHLTVWDDESPVGPDTSDTELSEEQGAE